MNDLQTINQPKIGTIHVDKQTRRKTAINELLRV